jgi:hypothetical protein
VQDVLGIGHSKGVSSIIVPGAGEANFDTMEVNPYATKRQRQEKEVKQLLEKVRYIGPDNKALHIWLGRLVSLLQSTLW